MSSMIPIADAINTKFENSTREELLSYCKEMGIEDVNERGDVRAIKNRLFEALGVSYRESGPDKPSKARVAAKSPLMPPVNLTPRGLWGGKRRRIKLPRPEGAKSARAEGFGWNGKATYWLPYDEVVAVPWPIYQILVDNKRRTPIQVKTIQGDGSTEITTGWEFNDISFSDLGDDPATKDLPASMVDWYQDKGVKFYEKLTPRQLLDVAARLELPTKGEDKKTLPAADILDVVLIFLYGVLSAESDPNAMLEEAAV